MEKRIELIVSELKSLSPLSIEAQTKSKDFADIVANACISSDISSVVALDLLQTMWMNCFHAPIESLRKASSIPSKASSTQELSQFLSSSITFFSTLLLNIQKHWGIHFKLCSPILDLSQAQFSSSISLPIINQNHSQSQQQNKQIQDQVMEISSRCLVFLGDLSRYSKTAQPIVAKTYYEQAVSLNPKLGMCHNQLGTIDYLNGDLLNASFHFALAASSLIPALKSRDNLAMALRKAISQKTSKRKRSSDNNFNSHFDESTFIEAFLQLITSILGFSSGDCGKLFIRMSSILQDYISSGTPSLMKRCHHDNEKLLLSVLVLSIFSCSHSISATPQSNQNIALQWIFLLVSKLSLACHSMPPCDSVMMIVHIFLIWFISTPEDFKFDNSDDMVLSNSWNTLWNSISGFLNCLIALPQKTLFTLERGVLFEEFELAGFSPLSNSLKPFPTVWDGNGIFKRENILRGEQSMEARKETLIQIGKIIASKPKSENLKCIFYSETDKRFSHTEPPHYLLLKTKEDFQTTKTTTIATQATQSTISQIPTAQMMQMEDSPLPSAQPFGNTVSLIDENNGEPSPNDTPIQPPKEEEEMQKEESEIQQQSPIKKQKRRNQPFDWLISVWPQQQQQQQRKSSPLTNNRQQFDNQFPHSTIPYFSISAINNASPLVHRSTKRNLF